MRNRFGFRYWSLGVSAACLTLAGCGGTFSHATRSLPGGEGLVDVAPPSSTPSSGAGKANVPAKLLTPAQKLRPPAAPVAAQASRGKPAASGPARNLASAKTPQVLDPPTLGSMAAVSSATDEAGYLLPAPLKKSVAGTVVAAKPPAPSTLPADVAALLSPDIIDRKKGTPAAPSPKDPVDPPSPTGTASLMPATTSPVAPPAPLAPVAPTGSADKAVAGVAIPRANGKQDGADLSAQAASGIALTGPSEIDPAELVAVLQSRRTDAPSIQQVRHEVPVPPPVADAPRTVALEDAPALAPAGDTADQPLPSVVTKEVSAEAPAKVSAATVADLPTPPKGPVLDGQVVPALADEQTLRQSPVVTVSAPEQKVGEKPSSESGDKPKSPAASELLVERFHFCTEINGFGSTLARGPGPMQPGERLLAYVEVRNFGSTTKEGLFETCLACRMRLEDERGQMVFSQDFGDIVDRCVTQRQDFFCHFLLTVPDTLPPGRYRWCVSVTDKSSAKTQEQVLECEIGSVESSERNDQ